LPDLDVLQSGLRLESAAGVYASMHIYMPYVTARGWCGDRTVAHKYMYVTHGGGRDTPLWPIAL
jgi:hypothetical protein